METQKRVKEIFDAESNAINNININDSYDKAIELLQYCKWKIVTIGIWKAWIIARKLATTLCSTATPAVYLHPSESAHWDFWIIDKQDCIIVLSTSWKSVEVLNVLELLNNNWVKNIIWITSHLDSKIRDYCEIILEMWLIKEPCPFNLTPSASTAVMLAICDAIAIVLMEKKKISINDYSIRHKGWYLWKISKLSR